MLCLGVDSSIIDIMKRANPGQSEQACRGVLSSWLNDKPGTGVAERNWHSVLEALESTGHEQLADKLRRVHFGESSKGPVSKPTSSQGVHVCVAIGCGGVVIVITVQL